LHYRDYSRNFLHFDFASHHSLSSGGAAMDVIDQLTSQSKTIKKQRNGEVIFSCPAHKDRTASASAKELPDGRILVHCFAGCSAEGILSSVGLPLSDLYPKAINQHIPRERRPFSASTLLQAISLEAGIIKVIGYDMVRGKAIKDTDYKRLELAVSRIESAMQMGGF
jgi:hypothetical protein